MSGDCRTQHVEDPEINIEIDGQTEKLRLRHK